jgi:toxin HigB-1
VIISFADKDTEAVYNDETQRRIPSDILSVVLRKLAHLNRATSLRDLADVPGNRLEKLYGDREGQYSMRVNNQWRVCFTWSMPDAANVEVVDYH